jgi:hypothetical protein
MAGQIEDRLEDCESSILVEFCILLTVKRHRLWLSIVGPGYMFRFNISQCAKSALTGPACCMYKTMYNHIYNPK